MRGCDNGPVTTRGPADLAPHVVAAGLDLRAEVAGRVEALAPRAQSLLVAVSGGQDSVAALRLLVGSRWRLAAAHFDHRLRPDSAEDAGFVRDLCDALGVRYHHGTADVAQVASQRGWNVEDAARRLRYAFLHRVASGAATAARAPADALSGEAAPVERYDAIVVAHTSDDQAETVLLQLFRGVAYPAGMAARKGMVIRPLLSLSRASLTSFLVGLGQPWRDDPTNLDLTRNRAWLRHEVLPAAERRFPGAARRVAHTASTLRAAAASLETLATERFGAGPLQVVALARAPTALRRVAIARSFEAAGVAPTRAAVTAVEAAVVAAARGSSVAPWRRDVGNGRVARVAYGRFEVVASRSDAVTVPHEVVARSAADLPPGVDPSVLDGHADLVVRAFRPGDRIRLAGGVRSVSDVLIDAKVPREERASLRLLVAGAADVLWIEGVAAAPGVTTGPVAADIAHMARALGQARLAAEAGELPVGAVVVLGGEVVGEAHNSSERDEDPTAHAEVLALRRAAAHTGDWRLSGATLFVTLEPCPMCMGAVLQTHLGRIVYGADNLREGAIGSVIDMRAGSWKRAPEVVGGVLAGASARLLREFFAARRA